MVLGICLGFYIINFKLNKKIMAQRRFWQWQDDDLTIDIDRWLTGIMGNGTYCGFDFVPTADLNLQLVHTATGFQYRQKDLTMSNNIGMLITQQGVMIQEDAAIILPILPNTDTHARIDIIIVSHFYDDSVVNGVQAEYSVITGTPSSSPVAPSVPDPTTDMIIATLFMPGNAMTLTALGVAYTKPDVPNFARVPNIYTSNNFINNGDTIQAAASKIDSALKILSSKYEVNTLTTPATASDGSSGTALSKFLSIDMPAVGDFFSAVIAITAGSQRNLINPLYGLYNIRVKQEAAFSNNPTVYINYLAGNMTDQSTITGRIVDNVSPSTVEFHLYGQNTSNESFAIRFLDVNKSSGAIVSYFNNQAWALIGGTFRFRDAQKIFKRVTSVSWPAGFTPNGAPFLLPILTTPNDGQKRSFSFTFSQDENFNDVGYQYMATLFSYYTSSGSLVNTAFAFGAIYWSANSDDQKRTYRSGGYSYIDVDPATTIYVQIATQGDSNTGDVTIANFQEIDKNIYAIT